MLYLNEHQLIRNSSFSTILCVPMQSLANNRKKPCSSSTYPFVSHANFWIKLLKHEPQSDLAVHVLAGDTGAVLRISKVKFCVTSVFM